jgi:PAS domain S-box-containing protein
VILDNIGEGYLVVNTRNQIVEANRLAGQIFGFTPMDILGQPVERVLSRWPGLLDILRQDKPVDEHANNQPVEIAIGDQLPQYLEAQVLDWYKFGKIKAGQVLILHDITRRRAAEEGLRESERLYSLVINAMPVGIAMTDENGQITFASPKLHELFQEKSGQDVIGMPATRWLHPDERAMGMLRILKVIEDKENLPSQEYRLMRPDGSVFWGEITSTPIIDDKGISKGLLAIIRDVSQRRILESRLQYNLDQQTFINSLLQILYRPHDLFAALSQVLEQTGIFTRASRVYLCRDSTDGAETTIVLEWCCMGISARARETPLFRYKAIPTWKECLKDRGMVLVQDPASAPEDIAEYMTTWNVLSLAAFPIYGSEERLYGFLGFDHCEEKRTWTNEELETLWNACRIVSGAVAQRQVEEAEHRQRILAEVLHDTASALNSTLNFEEVLDRVLVNLEQIVRHDAASIALVDEERIINFVR